MKTVGRLILLCSAAAMAVAPAFCASVKTLDIYFIDVEGGQSTLLITPAGQSLLIDAGFPGDGSFQSKPGDPRKARDPGRIAAVARDAGLEQIDYLLSTHFHADHAGGIPELAQLIPIRTFVDHGSVIPEADMNVPGTVDVFKAYAAASAAGRHLTPKPGDRLPLQGIDAVVVSAAGSVLTRPLPGAGKRNQACGATGLAAQEIYENPQSMGVLIRFGKFRFLDIGDLSGKPLFALACPRDIIGPVDVYLVAHHGGADAAEPATLPAFRPRVAILNNGRVKGAAPQTLTSLHNAQGVEDVWQLHRSELPGAANFADDRLANLDEQTAHWIKVSASDDGTFRVTNGRTGAVVNYAAASR
ncbi:MAG TPA: MBL fold metallo-hydrolase [Steroidobacteraceae bacterium]|nr:MBL fold metallo-hydrolase [Steroidobacteraceae bacterium]